MDGQLKRICGISLTDRTYDKYKKGNCLELIFMREKVEYVQNEDRKKRKCFYGIILNYGIRGEKKWMVQCFYTKWKYGEGFPNL